MKNEPWFPWWSGGKIKPQKENQAVKTFNPEKRKHWPIIQAYEDKKLSYAQAAAQLRDLGCEDWEVRLYLDNDQDGPD